MFKSILVLEAPWNNDSLESSSVWPMIREFAAVRDIKAFHQTFFDKASFEHWIKAYDEMAIAGPKLLYVACHGGNGQLGGLSKNLNRSSIQTAVQAASSISFVHFGTCLFGSEKNLKKLLEAAPHLRWVAGYDKEVDWIDSTLFDILLWGRIESRDEDSYRKKTHTLTSELIGQVQGLADQLGFCFQYRYGEAIWQLRAA